MGMKKEDQKKLVDYWRKTAAHDYDTMKSLFEGKRYDACLFFGHIVLEKALKALVAKNTGEYVPRTHNLMRLSELAELSLDDDDKNLLRDANDFNMEARYPSGRLEFYRQCTPKYTEKYFIVIDALYKKLCRQLKQKK